MRSELRVSLISTGIVNEIFVAVSSIDSSIGYCIFDIFVYLVCSVYHPDGEFMTSIQGDLKGF